MVKRDALKKAGILRDAITLFYDDASEILSVHETWTDVAIKKGSMIYSYKENGKDNSC